MYKYVNLDYHIDESNLKTSLYELSISVITFTIVIFTIIANYIIISAYNYSIKKICYGCLVFKNLFRLSTCPYYIFFVNVKL